MIENSVEELFNSINNSDEYREYKQIVDVIANDNEIKSLIEDIKKLEKEAVKLEYNNDLRYKEIDKIIEDKLNLLNNNFKYLDYLSKLKNFNNTLLASSSLLEEYIDSKISI